MSLFLRNLLWTLMCPGTVVLLLPRLLIYGPYQLDRPWHGLQWSGFVLFVLGVSVLLRCIYAFAREGRGTLSPADPVRRLIITGLYRYVRNPMYVGVVTALLGQALFFESPGLLAYTAIVFGVFHLFIRLHEEPYLQKQFGDEYRTYCAKVGRWWPGKRFEG